MISLDFFGSITETQRVMFESAAQRWDEIVDTAFAPVTVDDEQLDGLRIEASIDPIDGPEGVLGQAGPTVLLNGSELPAKGIMQFDSADVARLDSEGSLADVILHEMGHVLGLGTLWTRFDLINASGTNNPQFTGTASTREYAELLGVQEPRPVPAANTGGAGTREGHWRELVFGDELMTGFLSGTSRPISRLTIAGMADIGYRVDFDQADAYALPSFRELAEMGITEAVRICDLCRMGRPEPIVLPK